MPDSGLQLQLQYLRHIAVMMYGGVLVFLLFDKEQKQKQQRLNQHMAMAIAGK
jgi:hypothetical protein